MKVITRITIAEEIPESWQEQAKRNFNRTPIFGGADKRIKDHLRQLSPTWKDENIEVQYQLHETGTGEGETADNTEERTHATLSGALKRTMEENAEMRKALKYISGQDIGGVHTYAFQVLERLNESYTP